MGEPKGCRVQIRAERQADWRGRQGQGRVPTHCARDARAPRARGAAEPEPQPGQRRAAARKSRRGLVVRRWGVPAPALHLGPWKSLTHTRGGRVAWLWYGWRRRVGSGAGLGRRCNEATIGLAFARSVCTQHESALAPSSRTPIGSSQLHFRSRLPYSLPRPATHTHPWHMPTHAQDARTTTLNEEPTCRASRREFCARFRSPLRARPSTPDLGLRGGSRDARATSSVHARSLRGSARLPAA